MAAAFNDVFMRKSFLCLAAIVLIGNAVVSAQTATALPQADIKGVNAFYPSNKAPLLPQQFIKLPVTAFKPSGWLKQQLLLQKEGLTGNLGEISIWLSKTDNAWLNKSGKGKYGWEELPYWLKGYGDMAYMLGDAKMIKDTKFWINAVLDNQRLDGDMGPIIVKGNGNRDLWANMPMIWCLRSYYEYSHDARIIACLTSYFKWLQNYPEERFLKDYWENSRGGDYLVSIYWLYNITGDKFLLDLATKVDKNTANWRQATNLPNWHNVNVAECFREPATYYLQSHAATDLEATYNDFKLIRNIYGQVPGGMFGSDENARKGYDDPRQAVETCGMVEQMTSDQYLLQYTGDTFWAENCEDVAFNTFPAAFTSDYKALRYLTAPNMVLNDSKNHAPGIANSGPFLMMNPFSSRCCQHNHSAGWVYYAENAWMATPDNGLAAQLYQAGTITAKVGNGTQVKITSATQYPFNDVVGFTVNTGKPVSFPLYLRVPKWCANASVMVNGKKVAVNAIPGGYIKLTNKWKKGDKISLKLPMQIKVRQWAKNKNSVSVNYGPLTYSLKIGETYKKEDSKKTAMGDSGWQETADPNKWPSFEIYPATAWNYGLLLDAKHPERSFTVVHKAWPKDGNPFTNANAPIELKATGKQINDWTIDKYGLCGVLPQSPVKTETAKANLTLVPMGGARLRISAFPVVE
ncbi:beta-L-arabinofuranosidase domain-containing protein [Mucilaginibacter sp. UR6-11]|uniref:beta-L-arabinofuranosidase domain-containing protein n=1 Tax=Mucilaginibacter sp. UR6-11 TaxID=1435644 RepID=UPI001E4ACE2D|nr:beta-L-arabinofuranosidase domain-containing protein [Mucilaginibacter sp. UR6-11]